MPHSWIWRKLTSIWMQRVGVPLRIKFNFLIYRNSLLCHQSKDGWMADLNESALLVLILVYLDWFSDGSWRRIDLMRLLASFFFTAFIWGFYYLNKWEHVPIGFRVMSDLIFRLIFFISHFHPNTAINSVAVEIS